jgi:hypothetical protein
MSNSSRPTIFVFGSNLAGRHGAGSALHAWHFHGAEYGVGKGRTGGAYAIPTKDRNFRVLPLSTIALEVISFLEYAHQHPELTFHVVPIGCGLAGYKPTQIAPFFANAPGNCELPEDFLQELKRDE